MKAQDHFQGGGRLSSAHFQQGYGGLATGECGVHGGQVGDQQRHQDQAQGGFAEGQQVCAESVWRAEAQGKQGRAAEHEGLVPASGAQCPIKAHITHGDQEIPHRNQAEQGKGRKKSHDTIAFCVALGVFQAQPEEPAYRQKDAPCQPVGGAARQNEGLHRRENRPGDDAGSNDKSKNRQDKVHTAFSCAAVENVRRSLIRPQMLNPRPKSMGKMSKKKVSCRADDWAAGGAVEAPPSNILPA